MNAHTRTLFLRWPQKTASLPLALALGLVTAFCAPFACKRPEPTTGPRCDPSAVDPCAPNYRAYTCCSDDPMTIELADIEAFGVPTFDEGDSEISIFSARNNSRGRSGLCIGSSYYPSTWLRISSEDEACPVPCNPTWSDVDILAVCGEEDVCCPTGTIEPEDCVFDPALGNDGCWRPATGADIVGLGGLEATDWALDALATHQDPGGLGCQAFADSVDETTLAEFGLTVATLKQACLRRLTVLDQRGLCLADVDCPAIAAPDPDACEQLNLAEQLSDC